MYTQAVACIGRENVILPHMGSLFNSIMAINESSPTSVVGITELYSSTSLREIDTPHGTVMASPLNRHAARHLAKLRLARISQFSPDHLTVSERKIARLQESSDSYTPQELFHGLTDMFRLIGCAVIVSGEPSTVSRAVGLYEEFLDLSH